MKIGVVCGSWDMFHHGHMRLLKRARAACDYLVVGINNDERIKRTKSSDPIWVENHRLEVIR